MRAEGYQLRGVAIRVLIQADLRVDYGSANAQPDHHALQPVSLVDVSEGTVDNQHVCASERCPTRLAGGVPPLVRQAGGDLNTDILSGASRELSLGCSLILTAPIPVETRSYALI